MSKINVVDLGCKLGSALTEFRKRGHHYYGDQVRSIKVDECLGVDMQGRFKRDLEEQGYWFLSMDVTCGDALQELPEADFYLAWDFLEHLPDKGWATRVIEHMLSHARRGVWIRMPSFEQDAVTGEGALTALGLRFAWTKWHGHPTPLLVTDVVDVVNRYKATTGRNAITLRIKDGKRVRSTADPCVVPADAPVDTVKYREDLGIKPVQNFNPPLVGQWEVVITI